MRARVTPGLIETMRLRGDGSIDRLALHLARLEQSANALQIPFDPAAAADELAAIAVMGSDRRLRLELSPQGILQISTFPFQETDSTKPWRLAIAMTRQNSRQPLLRHKTTLRNHYLRARREFTATEADEVLLLNENDAVCEGTITNVFAQAAPGETLRTPALECGLLRGVLRQQLLDAGRASEAVLTVDDLQSAHGLYVGNSLRGLIAAKLSK